MMRVIPERMVSDIPVHVLIPVPVLMPVHIPVHTSHILIRVIGFIFSFCARPIKNITKWAYSSVNTILSMRPPLK